MNIRGAPVDCKKQAVHWDENTLDMVNIKAELYVCCVQSVSVKSVYEFPVEFQDILTSCSSRFLRWLRLISVTCTMISQDTQYQMHI